MKTTTSAADAPFASVAGELLIVGAGPAGMAAALAAAPSGASITLLDNNLASGGQIWRDGSSVCLPPQALRQREALARYDKLILCTGIRELLLPFPGWTLPGVTGVGGLQALIKGGLAFAGERIVIAGSGPLLLAVAATARRRGARVLRVAEQASLALLAGFTTPLARWQSKAIQALTRLDKNYRSSSHVVSAQGDDRVESVCLQQGDRVVDMACDRVACGYGLIPNTGLGQLLGCALAPASGCPPGLAFDSFQATCIPDVYAAGECTGFGGCERGQAQGRIAGHAAVGKIIAAQQGWSERDSKEAFASQLQRWFPLADSLRQLPEPETLVCRCEDVPHQALVQSGSWIDAKLHNRCAMGACLGRVCGAAAQLLHDWAMPAPRFPLSPARITTIASRLNED